MVTLENAVPRPRTISSPVFLLIMVLGTAVLSAENHLFGGGMALHGSYVDFETESGTVKGFMRGLGGRLHFNTGKFARIGGLGAALKADYGSGGSFFEVGYGGLSAELRYRFSRVQFTMGGAAGGGSVKHLHVKDSLDTGDIRARYERSASFILVPMIGAELFAGPTLSVALGIDYLVGTALGIAGTLGGPKVQIGVLFNR